MDSNDTKLTVYPLVSRMLSTDSFLPLRIVGPSISLGEERIIIFLYHLQELVGTFAYTYDPEMIVRLSIQDKSMLKPGIGLGIVVRLGSLIAQTAIDFDFGPIRYGFVSDFSPSDYGRQDGVIQNLLKNHITHVQFYDWNYRPHQYQPDKTCASVYQDRS